MFKSIIDVSSRDTDALGHVNNTSIPLWFETARNPLYKIFNPTMQLDPQIWNLIMVHTEFNYHDQIFYGEKIEIRTYVKKVGNSSCTVYQEAIQKDKIRATGEAVLVYYDFKRQEKKTIPSTIRRQLEEHKI